MYHYDFVDQGSKLNLRGKDQLAKMAAMLGHNFFPIVIERTPANPALAEARRLAVLNELAAGPFPVPPMRVVVGQPAATGLQGREAILIYQNLIRQTTNPAMPAPTLIQGTANIAGGGTGGGGGGGASGGGGGGASASVTNIVPGGSSGAPDGP
jgi:uncharacterized membrane protein YgcG